MSGWLNCLELRYCKANDFTESEFHADLTVYIEFNLQMMTRYVSLQCITGEGHGVMDGVKEDVEEE